VQQLLCDKSVTSSEEDSTPSGLRSRAIGVKTRRSAINLWELVARDEQALYPPDPIFQLFYHTQYPECVRLLSPVSLRTGVLSWGIEPQLSG
jgi:hypothetical protein